MPRGGGRGRRVHAARHGRARAQGRRVDRRAHSGAPRARSGFAIDVGRPDPLRHRRVRGRHRARQEDRRDAPEEPQGRSSLVVNKADRGEDRSIWRSHRLGFGRPVCVSAEHGRGEEELRKAIADRLAKEPEPAPPPRTPRRALRVCFIGRPNVGKSSLGNRLLQSDRLIVSPVAGTTRDAVELPFGFRDRAGQAAHSFRLIDTAGSRPRPSSPLRSSTSRGCAPRRDPAGRCHLLVLDAMDGVTQQDKAVAGEAVKERKPIVVLVNKWDLVPDPFAKREGLPATRTSASTGKSTSGRSSTGSSSPPGRPLVFVSALKRQGDRPDAQLRGPAEPGPGQEAIDCEAQPALLHLAERTPPPAIGARRFRIYYATQTGNRPFRIRLFCNREERLTESYRRYLEAGLVKEFGLERVPGQLRARGQTPRGEGRVYPFPMTKITETTYRGGAALSLSTRALELVVTTAVGPRVVFLLERSRGKAGNLFLELPPRSLGTTGTTCAAATGSGTRRRTSSGPTSPTTIRSRSGGCRTGFPDAAGRAEDRAPEGDRDRGPRRPDAQGHAYLPTGTSGRPPAPRGRSPCSAAEAMGSAAPAEGQPSGGDLLPTGSLVPWPFTDLSLPVWNIRRDFIGIDVAKGDGAEKLGITRYPGWSAYWRRGDAFVKLRRRRRRRLSRPGLAVRDLHQRVHDRTRDARADLQPGPGPQRPPPRVLDRGGTGWPGPTQDRSFRPLAER